LYFRAVDGIRVFHVTGVQTCALPIYERALGEEAVPDLATLRRPDPAGLTGGVRREVVVVHVALVRHRRQRVDLLLHLEHVQRGRSVERRVWKISYIRILSEY